MVVIYDALIHVIHSCDVIQTHLHSSHQITTYSLLELEQYCQTFSLHFNGHFPGGLGLASIRITRFWISLELRMMEMKVTTGAIRHAKLRSNRHHQQTITHLISQARCPSYHPTNSVRALKEKEVEQYCQTFFT